MSHENHQPHFYNGGYQEASYAQLGAAAPDPPQPDQSAPWRDSPGPAAHSYGYRCDFPPPAPGLEGFGAPHMSHPYGFDPSVPPPPFICPPAPDFSFPRNYSANCGPGPQNNRYDFHQDPKRQQHEYRDFRESGGVSFPPRGAAGERSPGRAPHAPAAEEKLLQRRQDELWVRRFLQGRDAAPQSPQTGPTCPTSIGEMRDALYGAARLVSALSLSCETLRDNVDNEDVWTDSYAAALRVKEALQDTLRVLGDEERLSGLKAKLSRVSKRRERRGRANRLGRMEEALREERAAEKEAAIDKWRMKRIHDVEEKKKERELKLAADAVLCEVRKKQADVKRMQDILKSLEKLRKLRKEAASRKGIFTDQESEESFDSRLERLRSVMRKRTAIYATEEKALMVMLEGEQEEERRREREKRQKKERERLLQRKQQMDAMLFGEEMDVHAALRPFTDYHTQAERSLHALLQIRREWDDFLVAADHPDGTTIPQGWITPDPPSDPAWASALHNTDDL
ncbi:programmed cell death protein 7 [Genypterus blacodes]|uniref:programmed cell death protein 7 n=1 Tax=Genypterus blacodes TaxID=154954 RepID=UPI003F76F1DE